MFARMIGVMAYGAERASAVDCGRTGEEVFEPVAASNRSRLYQQRPSTMGGSLLRPERTGRWHYWHSNCGHSQIERMAAVTELSRRTIRVPAEGLDGFL